MGISSALNAGVMGLQVQSSKLSTISDNIANSETKGYKRADMEFASLVLSERPTTYDAGGVRAATVRYIEDQGAVLGTRNVLDLALSGKGFLPVTPSNQVENPDRPFRLVRTGSFKPDAQGYVRTSNGYALMGWRPDADGSFASVARESTSSLVPIKIDNVGLAADPTSEIKLFLNLDDSQTGVPSPPGPSTDPAFSMPMEFFDNLGGSGQLKFDFYQTTQARTWKMNLQQVLSDGSTQQLASGEVVFDTNGKLAPNGFTLYPSAKSLPNPVSTAIGAATGARGAANTDLTGATTLISNAGTPWGGTPSSNLADALTAASTAMTNATTALTNATNAETAATVSPDSARASVEAARAAFVAAETELAAIAGTAPGAAVEATIITQLNTATTRLNEALANLNSATADLSAPVSATPSGATSAAYDPLTGELNLSLGAASGNQQLAIYVGKPGSSDGLQGLKKTFTPYITKNGSPASDLRSLEIDEKGNLNAVFESGFRRTLYRIPVGMVISPNGLTALDGPAYSISSKSGGIYFYDAGTGPTGRMVSSALEESTTDVAEELTQLIKTQRAYSSNAKIIQTADEMLQETTNLKR